MRSMHASRVSGCVGESMRCWCWRRHRIRIKDVAGLVRGAYRGRGRGNRFLNDLCDADVLIHVVDGAGETDAEGGPCAAGQGSTLDDITWVRAEVHHWIYDNLRHRWPALVRQPHRLREMFTGYRSSPAFIDAVLRRWWSGGGEWQASLPQWQPADLHRLVALYLRLRFPMVTALNKADRQPTASRLAAALRARYPVEHLVPMSARVESDLLTLRRAGRVRYEAGAHSFERLLGNDDTSGQRSTKEEEAMMQRAHDYFYSCAGCADCAPTPAVDSCATSSTCAHACASLSLPITTGVQNVLAAAMVCVRPVLVFPVLAFPPAHTSLRHCLLYRGGGGAGTVTAESVYWALVDRGWVTGKLVRFEVMDATVVGGGGRVQTLRKGEAMPSPVVLVRVLTNKKQMHEPGGGRGHA